MKYLILGASAAGINCAKTLRTLDKDGEITVISKDEQIYSRCMLHHVISNNRTVESLNFIKDNLFEDNKITWLKGKIAKSINLEVKSVVLDDDNILSYDKLLIATGASSFIPPVKNLREAKGVYSLRNIEDVQVIKEKIKDVKDLIVLGAGLVGIDAVVGLMRYDASITLVELADRILPMQLDKEAAKKYEDRFREEGVRIYTGVKAEEVILDEKDSVKALKLSNGEVICCQMVVVATGVRPNIDFIPQSTINIDKGIIIDDTCLTNVSDIYAAGDVCAINPIWPLAVKQGITAAFNMAGKEKHLDDTFGLRNSLNFKEIQTVSLGLIEAPDDSYNVHIYKDKDDYKKIIEKDGIIYGAILQGDIAYCGTLTYLIKNKINIASVRKNIFEIDYSDFYDIKENGEYTFAAL